MMGQVISISGPPGAGKSALSALLARAWRAQVVAYDAFETMTRKPPTETMDWLERGAPYEEIETPGLEAALITAKNSGRVVFDTPLGRAHPSGDALIDIAIWIECPLDVALARKIAQLTQHVDANHAASFTEWLKAYLAHYELIIRPACLIQQQRVAEACDLKLDGSIGLNALLSSVQEIPNLKL